MMLTAAMPMHVRRSLALVVVLAASDVSAQRIVEGVVREENLSIPYVLDTGDFEWSARFHYGGADFVRLQLKVGSTVPSTPFKVIIAGRDGVAQTFTEATLPAGREFWTPLISGAEATVKVEGRPSGLRLTVTRVAYQVDPHRILSIIGPDDERKEFWEVAKDTPALAAAGKSVAKLSIITPGGPAACTGFMVSDDLLLTNEHCITAQVDCDNTMVIFGHQRDETGVVRFGEQFQCSALLDHDSDLDFALVKVAGSPGAPRSWGSLRLSQAVPALGVASMIQHPGGHPKRIAFPPNCKVLMTQAEGHTVGTTVDLAHDCDCEDGASGSPVLNAGFEVIALHRRGKTVVGPYGDKNRAVRMEKIYPRIKPLLPAPIQQ